MRVTTPLLLQMHVTECGAACLGSVLAYFGRWVSLTELRERCEVSRDGSSAAGIKRAANYYGLECVGRSLSVDDLPDKKMPLILFWEFNHFVVLEGFENNRFHINDPSSGRRSLTAEQFSASFTGVALEFSTGREFQSGGSRTSFLKELPNWLGDSRGAIAQIVLCGLLLVIPALMTPAILAVFIDHVLGGSEPWGGILAATLIGAAVLAYALTLLKKRWLKRLAVRISVIVGDRTVSQLLRLPIDFFNHRFVGDLTARILSINRVTKAISEHFLELLIEMFLSFIFLIVLFIFAPSLALIVLGLAAVNAFLAYIIARIRLDKSLTLRREQGLLVGIGTLMLNQSEILRQTASDDRFYSRWSGHQARELHARQDLAEVAHINESLPTFFGILGNAAVLTFGAVQVMDGEITLGTLAGFFVLSSMFLASIGHFVEFVNHRQSIEADMQRLQDIPMIAESADLAQSSEDADVIHTLDGRLKISGHVELRNITFGYNRSKPPLIEDFSLIMEPGQRVAVVGPSGSGKSTLTRLVSGLYEPWSGEILFDGHPRQEVASDILKRSLSVVDQQIRLFSTTVRRNITLWNPTVPDEVVVAATKDACIHNEILNRPHGYATEVAENGSNFSGGQKQRLEIARALASEPVVLILDEATSALDAENEEEIDHALRRRGVTCLIIAHRLSTIRDCDQIIVLDQGKEVQRGTHDELITDQDGLYYRLVRSN